MVFITNKNAIRCTDIATLVALFEYGRNYDITGVTILYWSYSRIKSKKAKTIMMQPTNSSHSIADHFTSVIYSLCEIAELYYYLAKLDEAVNVLQTGLQLTLAKEVHLRDRVKLTLEYGRVLVANYFLSNKDFALALATSLEAKQLAEAVHYEKGTADALSLIGQAHYYKKLNTHVGDYEEAFTYFQQALKIREKLRDTRGISEALFYSGLTYEQRGLFENALESYTEALQFADLYNHKLEKSYALRHLAWLASERGDLDAALNYALTSLALREEIGFRVYLPHSHILVGDIYLAREDSENALINYQNAQGLAEEMEIKNALIRSLLAIGNIQLVQADKVQARENFQHAHTLAQELGIPVALEETTEKLAQAE
jgi:tetratricopeptide (TPR) repeat protein